MAKRLAALQRKRSRRVPLGALAAVTGGLAITALAVALIENSGDTLEPPAGPPMALPAIPAEPTPPPPAPMAAPTQDAPTPSEPPAAAPEPPRAPLRATVRAPASAPRPATAGDSRFWWLVTYPEDPQRGRAVHGVRCDGSGVDLLYEPANLPRGSLITTADSDPRHPGRLAMTVRPSDGAGALHWGVIGSDEIHPMASRYRDRDPGKPRWIPGTDEVVFSNYGSGIHRMDLDPNTDDERVITDNYFDELTAATATSIWFENSMHRPPPFVWTMNLDGSGLRSWSPFGDHQERTMALSPDGRMIAFAHFIPGGGAGLWVAPIDGAPTTPDDQPLARAEGLLSQDTGAVAWAADGETICFVSGRDLWTIRTDGTDLLPLTSGETTNVRVWGTLPAPSPASAAGRVIHVNLAARGSGTGTSWGDAFTSVQAAIDASQAGDEIWVAQGTYADRQPNPTGSIVLRADVALYGGFAGNETERDQRDPRARRTTLDGSTARGGSPAYHVVVGADRAVLDGFTISGGVADGPTEEDRQGAGLLNTRCSPTVRNCVFRGQTTRFPEYSPGGAMANWDTQTSVIDCLFTENTGGAVTSSSPDRAQFTRCVFDRNTSVGAGAAVFNGSQTFRSCVFTNNAADQNGGACFFHWDSSPTFENCVFANNRSRTEGAAIVCGSGLQTLINCTFAGNSSGASRGTISVTEDTAIFRNIIVWGNAGGDLIAASPRMAEVTHSDLQSSVPGEGNISQDPLFADAAGGDFRLRPGSPCIDTGGSEGAPATDAAGVSRPQGHGVDMGAFESQGGGG